MAGRQSHLLKIRSVPSAHQDAPARRVSFYLPDDISKLVYPLAGIIIVHGLVLSTEMAPLKAIDRPKIPLFSLLKTHFVEKLSGGVSVPDFDLFVTEIFGICIALNKPYQLFSDASPEHILGGENGEALFKVESHLIAEFPNDANSCSVILNGSCLYDILDNLEILHLRMLRVFLKKARRDQLWLALEELLVSHEAIVVGQVLILIGFGDVDLGEGASVLITGYFRHKSVCLEDLPDSCQDYELAVLRKTLQSLFINCAAPDDIYFVDSAVRRETQKSLLEIAAYFNHTIFIICIDGCWLASRENDVESVRKRAILGRE